MDVLYKGGGCRDIMWKCFNRFFIYQIQQMNISSNSFTLCNKGSIVKSFNDVNCTPNVLNTQASIFALFGAGFHLLFCPCSCTLHFQIHCTRYSGHIRFPATKLNKQNFILHIMAILGK